MKPQWTSGNRFALLENGDQYYPRVFERIAQAKFEVMIETFILFEDKVGIALRDVLVAAAQRGVEVHLTLDDYGSPDLSEAFMASLVDAGVHVHLFDPGRKYLGRRLNMLRRLHRKLVTIDGEIAFIGGINFSADHLADFGDEAKLDHAAEAQGPIVTRIRDFMREQLGEPPQRGDWARRLGNRFRRHRSPVEPDIDAEGAEAMLVTRDNNHHRDDIERHYRIAIRTAKRRVWIANAYFFPGYRLLRELRRAGRRGIDVRVILQGQPDVPFARFCASMLYHHLLRASVKVHEYCEKPMHSKIALVDHEWATIGSSNLDPLSLSLNLEANLVIRDRSFNQRLSERMEHLVRHSCKEIRLDELHEPKFWLGVRNFIVFHLLRYFPRWAGWLPAHVPRFIRARLPRRRKDQGVNIVERCG